MLDESLVTGPGNDVGLVAGRSVRRRDYQCKWKRKQTDLQGSSRKETRFKLLREN